MATSSLRTKPNRGHLVKPTQSRTTFTSAIPRSPRSKQSSDVVADHGHWKRATTWCACAIWPEQGYRKLFRSVQTRSALAQRPNLRLASSAEGCRVGASAEPPASPMYRGASLRATLAAGTAWDHTRRKDDRKVTERTCMGVVMGRGGRQSSAGERTLRICHN